MSDFAFAPPPPPPPPSAFAWTEEQHKALDDIEVWYQKGYGKTLFDSDDGSPFYSLTGPAGTGKTTLVRELISQYPTAALAAMTGKAALRLSELSGSAATTLHKILYYPPKPGEDLRFTRLREPPASLVIIDESSMTSPSVFNDLRRWNVRALLVGDSFQLPPVITDKKDLEMYGEDYSVFSQVQGAELRTVMRNAGGVLKAATFVRETGEICTESYLDGPGMGYEYARERQPLQRAVNDYLSDRNDHMLITWKNAARMDANKVIREKLGHEGPLPDVGEPVLLKKNGQGFLNGEIVVCGGFEAGPMIDNISTLWMSIANSAAKLLVSYEGGDKEKGGEPFDGQMPWIKNWRAYHVELQKQMLPEPCPATFGYCLTSHSAQGSQARRATIFLDRGDERSKYFRKSTTLPSGETVPFAARFLYTAMTRSKQHTTMIVG